jgi:Fe-S-cluster containining protein
MIDDAYTQLVAKVEGFCAPVAARRSADMACRAGCSACCEAWLTVSAVEAANVRRGLASLDGPARERARQRGREQSARERAGATEPRCALLEADGTCAIYAHRPLVCRTQGHALRYPAGLIPAAALRATTQRVAGDVTHCSLNYTASPPAGEDVVDAERVDLILAVVNARLCASTGIDPESRIALSDLAEEAG